MLPTNLKHLGTEEEAEKLVKESKNVMICCGRMGPMCVPVYAAMQQIESSYPHVEFRDMEFDEPEAAFIRNLPQCRSFMGLPFTVYFRDSEVVEATSGIQTQAQVESILQSKLKEQS